MITLKEHNVKPYAQLCEMLAVHQKCAYIAATGTGKSYVVGKYIEDHDLVDKTLVLVPSNAIKDAWEKLLPGLAVITYQGLLSGENDFSWAELIVCDEMHHLGAVEWGKVCARIIENFAGKLVGVTATPIRFLDNSRNMVDEFFDGISVEGLDLPEAISCGVLPSFDYITALYNLPAPDMVERNETTEKLFRQLDFMRNEYSFQNILRKYLDYGNHKAAVFINQIDGIDEVAEMCKGVYPQAGHYVIHSRMSQAEVKDVISQFEGNSGMAFIYTVDMFNEGVHISGIDTVVMFRRTESPNIYLQQLGRALSSDMAEQRVKIFDFVANHKNLKSVKDGGDSVIAWVQAGISNQERQIVVRDYALEEMELLDRINNLLSGQWTEEEENLIREKYGTRQGNKELRELLPHRTRGAIAARAFVLGVTDSKELYSDEFYEDLKRLYQTKGGLKELKEKYPQYTETAIRGRANSIGLKRRERPKDWTEQEDEIIKSHPDLMSRELTEMLPNRTSGAIQSRRAKLGLVRDTIPWTDDMDEVLRSNPNMTGRELKEKFFPDFCAATINHRRHKVLGVPARETYWNARRKKILMEAYAKGGVKEARKIEEFSHLNTRALSRAACRFNMENGASKTEWSEDELKVIEDYLDMSVANRPKVTTLADNLPGRTMSSIYQKKRILEQQRKEAEANGTDTKTTGAADPTDTKTEAQPSGSKN